MMIVKYACEGEVGPFVGDVNELVRRFLVAGIDEDRIDDMVGALDMWGGYQGSHDHGRFVVVRLDPADAKEVVSLLASA